MMLTGEHFVREGLIGSDQLDMAMERQRESGGADSIAKILVTMGYISERDRVRCLGDVWGVQYVEMPATQLR
ncbi:hypothetical protein EON81_30330, partial [bacterium]